MFTRRSLVIICRTIVAGVLLTGSLFSSAQLVASNPQSVEKRVDDLVARMTVAEKIDLISGDTPFRTHPIPRLNIPFFQMADGPVGAHIPAPTMPTLPASVSPLLGTKRWLCASGSNSAATPALAVRHFSSARASTSIGHQ